MTRKADKENDQTLKAASVSGLGVEKFLDGIPDRAHDEHDVDQRRNQGQQHLEDDDVGQRNPAQHAARGQRRSDVSTSHCRMPNDQRKRWRIRPRALTGASV